MDTLIKQTLREIEERSKVKILYACETGSRAWGFPSPDSDYDVRIIYRHEPDWYLSLSEGKDTIELMAQDGELDITGWDIKKCLKLMWKSNGALLERVQSPIVYYQERDIAAVLRDYSRRCFAPIAAMHHYLGMARNSAAELMGADEVKLKKLFYALRATLACKWILDKDDVPPIVFTEMVEQLSFAQEIKEKIYALITLKAGQNESYIHPADKKLTDFIATETERAAAAYNTLAGKRDKSTDLDELFRRIIKTY